MDINELMRNELETVAALRAQAEAETRADLQALADELIQDELETVAALRAQAEAETAATPTAQARSSGMRFQPVPLG